VLGGVHAVVDRYVRPESLLEGIGQELGARGVVVREQVAVSKLSASNGQVRLRTSAGDVEADRAVVAAGASSPPLLRELGVSLPLVPARGYSFTFAGDGLRPRHALYLAEAKVGISAYTDSVRVAGVFELGHADEAVDAKSGGRAVSSRSSSGPACGR
jgi:D-amino-acid dehydrogenase